LILLAVARLLAGAMAGSSTTAGAYIADLTPPEKRAQSFGLIGAMFGLGFITGPIVGGLLGAIDLHLPFLVAGLLCVANFAFSYFALSESLEPENRGPFRLSEANPVGALREIGRYSSLYVLMAIFVLGVFANRVSEMTWVLYTSYRFHWTTFDAGLSLAAVGVIFVVGQGWFVRVLIGPAGRSGRNVAHRGGKRAGLAAGRGIQRHRPVLDLRTGHLDGIIWLLCKCRCAHRRSWRCILCLCHGFPRGAGPGVALGAHPSAERRLFVVLGSSWRWC